MINDVHLFAGIDHLSLDKNNFDPSRDDIEQICRFFSIGKLLHCEKEKGIIVSHSHHFVFSATTQGHYALKFYPKDAAPRISTEYAVNRILVNHHFPTPQMYAGHDGQPFFTSHDLLVTCYSYIDGSPAWQDIKKSSTIHHINAAILSLKNILSTTVGRVPILKQVNLVTSIDDLARESKLAAPLDHQDVIDASLLDACRAYQQHRSLFTRQYLHNNTTLTNMLLYKSTVYVLDLIHIREDYALSDLAGLVVSCLFLEIHSQTIRTIIDDYFTQHKKGPEYLPVLDALIRINLIKDYLKNIRRERSINLSAYPEDLRHTFQFHLSARKEFIAAILKNKSGRIESAAF